MGFFSRAPEPPPHAHGGQDLAREQAQMGDLKELARHLDEDRRILLQALQALQPGLGPLAMAEALYPICFRPLGLATYYLAIADWEQDLLHFPYYFEGARNRPREARCLSEAPGLTGEALRLGSPLYIRNLEEGKTRGVILSQMETESGLAPQTWYGVPLGADPSWGQKPFGLLNFQSFQPDAFPESRLKLMDGLAAILAFALKAAPGAFPWGRG